MYFIILIWENSSLMAFKKVSFFGDYFDHKTWNRKPRVRANLQCDEGKVLTEFSRRKKWSRILRREEKLTEKSSKCIHSLVYTYEFCGRCLGLLHLLVRFWIARFLNTRNFICILALDLGSFTSVSEMNLRVQTWTLDIRAIRSEPIFKSREIFPGK